MHDPDILDALIARIEAECPVFVTVDEAPFAEPVEDYDTQTPAALVYLAEDGATGPPQTTRAVQAVSLTYGVWVLCPRDRFKECRQQLREALFGHLFSQYHQATAYRGGQTSQIRGQLIWWREFWQVGTWLRDAP